MDDRTYRNVRYRKCVTDLDIRIRTGEDYISYLETVRRNDVSLFAVGIGYKWALGPRMYLDLGASAGFFYSRYDPFVWGNDPTGWYYYDYSGDPADFVRRRMSLSWFGPTRVYISLGINLFDRNNKK